MMSDERLTGGNGTGGIASKKRRRVREIDPDSPRDAEARLERIFRIELIRKECLSRQN